VGNEKGGGSGEWLLFEDGFRPWRSMSVSCLMLLNKARPLCDLIKLNTILAQEYVAGKASTGTHVTSDLLNTGRFYMALYPPTRVLTSRLRGYLSIKTSRGHLGTTYMVSPEDKHRDISRTKEDKKRTHHIQPVLQLVLQHTAVPQPRPASFTASPGSTAHTYLGLTHLTTASHNTTKTLDISTSA
jgi:hypothetical protein